LRHAPQNPVALQNSVTESPAKIPFVYKRASGAFPDAAPCLLYKQWRKANEFLCSKRGFSSFRPLDSVSVRAQHRSYTNKVTVSPQGGMIGASE
jgi:hypothetical protein